MEPVFLIESLFLMGTNSLMETNSQSSYTGTYAIYHYFSQLEEFTFNCKQMALYDAVLFMVLFVSYSLSLGWDEMTPKKVRRFSRISRAFISTTDL
jgi:hypothetical protein